MTKTQREHTDTIPSPAAIPETTDRQLLEAVLVAIDELKSDVRNCTAATMHLSDSQLSLTSRISQLESRIEEATPNKEIRNRLLAIETNCRLKTVHGHYYGPSRSY